MPFEFISYGETLDQIKTVGSGLANLGLSPKEGLGIYAANRMEWMLAQMGGYSQNLICVPLYDTLGEDAVKYEINTGLLGEEAGGLWHRIPAERKRLRRESRMAVLFSTTRGVSCRREKFPRFSHLKICRFTPAFP